MEPQHAWLLFGLFCSLLPTYLLVRAVLHVFNINLGQRWRTLR